jgi:hypothetical protein
MRQGVAMVIWLSRSWAFIDDSLKEPDPRDLIAPTDHDPRIASF